MVLFNTQTTLCKSNSTYKIRSSYVVFTVGTVSLPSDASSINIRDLPKMHKQKKKEIKTTGPDILLIGLPEIIYRLPYE
jgi:hypothetical protein